MHDVFPKAKFRDCISMTEKAGHEQRLKVMRKQWIDDTKPKSLLTEEDLLDVDGAEILADIDRQAGNHGEAASLM
jgi:replication fork protection complex subunit Csm3/Swi3